MRPHPHSPTMRNTECKIGTAPSAASASPAAAQQPAADASQPRKHGSSLSDNMTVTVTKLGQSVRS